MCVITENHFKILKNRSINAHKAETHRPVVWLQHLAAPLYFINAAEIFTVPVPFFVLDSNNQSLREHLVI